MQNPTLAYPIADRSYLDASDRCARRCAVRSGHTATAQVHGYDLMLSASPAPVRVINASGNPAGYQEMVFCGFGVVA